MTSNEALNNIEVKFNEMKMICSSTEYKEFWEKDLYFKEIFESEYELIKNDLEVLEIIKKYFIIKMIDVLGTKTITIMEKREPFNIVAHIVTSKNYKLLKEALSNDR